ncbi:hypothetical protein [Actinophytocola sp.]|uniref:hypothetical protein n=1 Tax=Actinophytocola sp. TaxID=1872138 RepID=UPI002D811297|nr:hypothetical protein [Actinophytocola sp.]HET9144037.1 hypothetical protein [Actinophytocola sp.]
MATDREILTRIADLAVVGERHDAADDALAAIRKLADEQVAAAAGMPSDRDVLLDTADALRAAGEALFNAPGAPVGLTRRVWKTEDRVREHFGLPNPDAVPTSDPEKKE